MPEHTSSTFWENRLREEGLSPQGPSREIPFPPEALDRFPRRVRRPQRDLSLPLEVLTPRQREVIFSLFYDSLTEEETARVLGISRSSVRTHRARALKRLRKSLGDRPSSPPG